MQLKLFVLLRPLCEPCVQATAVNGTVDSLPGTLPVTTQAYGCAGCACAAGFLLRSTYWWLLNITSSLR